MERKALGTGFDSARGGLARLVGYLRSGAAGHGVVRVRVKGNSMLPGLPHGSAVTVRRCLDKLVPGALVVYHRGSDLVVHRIVDVRRGPRGRVFLTKGDNNRFCDEPVSERQMIGRVVAVEPAHPLR